MKITEIETIALHDPAAGSETIVRVHTDAGVTGIGQAESPSLVIEAIINCSGGLKQLLLGEDPTQVARLWQKMYAETGLFGRRGVTLAAIGAVETALWDITGKAQNKPLCELIWRTFGAGRGSAVIKHKVKSYATVYPPGDSLDEIRSRIGDAVARNFHAIKIEEWPGGFGHGNLATDIAIARLARQTIGEQRDLLFDLQHLWQDVGQAMTTIRAIAPYRPFFIEAPLPADNVEAYARLADAVDTRIAVGDWGFASRYEYEDLLVRGHVDVVQPSTVRSGGIGEILWIAEAAYRRGALCIPHAWCHMIGVATAVHIAAVTPNMPYFEYPIAYPDSPIISELLDPPLLPDSDGLIAVPNRPGLGFNLNEETVRKYRVRPQ